jgi:hypothetical protein
LLLCLTRTAPKILIINRNIQSIIAQILLENVLTKLMYAERVNIV